MENIDVFDIVEVISAAEDEDFSYEERGDAYRVEADSLEEGNILLNTRICYPREPNWVHKKMKIVRIVLKGIPADEAKFFSPLRYTHIIGYEPLDFDNKIENSDENDEQKFDIVEVTYLTRRYEGGEFFKVNYCVQAGCFKEGEIIASDNPPFPRRWKITGILKNVSSDVAKFFRPYDITKLLFLVWHNGHFGATDESSYPSWKKEMKRRDEENRMKWEKYKEEQEEKEREREKEENKQRLKEDIQDNYPILVIIAISLAPVVGIFLGSVIRILSTLF